MDSKTTEWCFLWQAPCLPSSEWASWAQAIFSAVAVLAAIGVVWWQHYVARRNALAAAQLAASGLLTFIDQTIASLQFVAGELKSRIDGTDSPSNHPRQLANILDTLHLPSREELLALSLASPDCSIRLLRASNSTRQIRTALEVIVTVTIVGVNSTTLPYLLRPLFELASNAAAQLIEARETLDQLSPK